jgi:hypothetical protein
MIASGQNLLKIWSIAIIGFLAMNPASGKKPRIRKSDQTPIGLEAFKPIMIVELFNSGASTPAQDVLQEDFVTQYNGTDQL